MGRGRPKKWRCNRLTPDERGRAVGMREMGAGIKEIARKLGCEPKSVRELLKKYESEGSTKDLPKSGRPKKLSPREGRHIKITSALDRRATAKAIALKVAPNFSKNKVSVPTVRRY